MSALASCSEKDEPKNDIVLAEPAVTTAAASTETPTEPTTKAELHEHHDYEDGVLLGSWQGLFMNITFKDDNTASADFDISDILMVDYSGNVLYNGDIYPPDSISYDGSELTISIKPEGTDSPAELAKLVRTGEADPDSIDGEYSFSAGTFYTSICSALGSDEKEPDLKMIIDDGYFYIKTDELCSYTQKADEISFSNLKFSTEIVGLELDECTFVLDGNECTLYDKFGVIEELKKIADNSADEETNTAE